MTPFQTIVVGIDFSDASVAALKEAVRLARLEEGKVYAVQVLDREHFQEHVRYHGIAVEQAVAHIHSHLVRHLATHGATEGVEAHVVPGSPASGLEEAATRCGADLMVLGSRGWDHHVAGEIGAVASKCVRRSARPVLLVRRFHAGAFRRMVACTDYSPAACLAVARAMHLAAKEGSHLDIVHVDFPTWLQPVHVQYDLLTTPDPDYQAQYRAAIRGRLEQHVALLGTPEGLETACHVLEDVRAADGIISFLDRAKADLVVLGTSGRGGLSTFLPGTTTERLLHRSLCSVLTVKPPETG